MEKIISMSVWGNDPRYVVGALRQYELAKYFYPDFKVRIYVDNTLNYKNFPKDITIIDAGHTNTYGMFWRFLPLFENDNNIVLVRDSDSRISIRESLAVKEWLDSDKIFHVFRDHEAHYEFPIIGCAFAMKGKLSEDIHNAMTFQMTHNKFYLSDQFFLRDYVYPAINTSIMVHSMDEGWFGKTRKNLVNPYDFCGNGYDENDMPLYAPTLKECQGFDPKILSKNFKFNNGIMVNND